MYKVTPINTTYNNLDTKSQRKEHKSMLTILSKEGKGREEE